MHLLKIANTHYDMASYKAKVAQVYKKIKTTAHAVIRYGHLKKFTAV
jgi:hypothetical protein